VPAELDEQVLAEMPAIRASRYAALAEPRVPQVRLWDLTDFELVHNDSADHVFANSRTGSVAATLRSRQPWQGEDELSADMIERIKLWRYLRGDRSGTAALKDG